MEPTVLAQNNLRGIQHEINRMQRMIEEKRNTRKDYIAACLNSGVSQDYCGDMWNIFSKGI